jgi:hypothetical protein
MPLRTFVSVTTKMASAYSRSTSVLRIAVEADNAIPDLLTFGARFEELLEIKPDIRSGGA